MEEMSTFQFIRNRKHFKIGISYIKQLENMKTYLRMQVNMMGKKKDKIKSSSGKKGKVPAGRVMASHILVEKLSLAQDIKHRLDEGEDFRKLANEYSTCPSKKRGGDLGIFGRGEMVLEFERAVYKMNIGEISDPIKTKFGYHLIKRTG